MLSNFTYIKDVALSTSIAVYSINLTFGFGLKDFIHGPLLNKINEVTKYFRDKEFIPQVTTGINEIVKTIFAHAEFLTKIMTNNRDARSEIIPIENQLNNIQDSNSVSTT